jgi:phosphoglycolate phosphatase
MTLRLVIFDVDGTISDSQSHIHHAMSVGFEAVGQVPPPLEQVRAIVGLSLPQAVAELAPALPLATRDAIVAAYKASYMGQRKVEPAPLYPGAADFIRRLAARDDLVLAIATGKSKRGLDALLAHHGLEGIFVSRQVADNHPSKPHPSMIEACLAETGVAAADAVMLGDTSFDMEMARAAGVAAIGVRWGYHAPEVLVAAGARCLVADFAALGAALDEMWSAA